MPTSDNDGFRCGTIKSTLVMFRRDYDKPVYTKCACGGVRVRYDTGEAKLVRIGMSWFSAPESECKCKPKPDKAAGHLFDLVEKDETADYYATIPRLISLSR